MKKKKESKALKSYSIKIPASVRKALQANAIKYAKGNLSAWLRHAGIHHVPRKSDEIVSIRRAVNFY